MSRTLPAPVDRQPGAPGRARVAVVLVIAGCAGGLLAEAGLRFGRARAAPARQDGTSGVAVAARRDAAPGARIPAGAATAPTRPLAGTDQPRTPGSTTNPAATATSDAVVSGSPPLPTEPHRALPPDLADGASLVRGPRQAYDSQWQWTSGWASGGASRAADARRQPGWGDSVNATFAIVREGLARHNRLTQRLGPHPAMDVEFQVLAVPASAPGRGLDSPRAWVGADFAVPASAAASARWYTQRWELEPPPTTLPRAIDRLETHERRRRALDVQIAERLVLALDRAGSGAAPAAYVVAEGRLVLIERDAVLALDEALARYGRLMPAATAAVGDVLR